MFEMLKNGHGDAPADVLAVSDDDDDSDDEYEDVDDVDPDEIFSSVLAPKHKLSWTA